MDKLEQYLDQVCRGLGGPKGLRQHVRQELREHLRDAAAEHRAAGLLEEEALARALANFGMPEDVRSELEATHGHRMMGVVIDKAMQWKEMTMRAKWLWVTWAYLALALVIALEALFITFNVVFIVPRFEKLMLDGIIDPASAGEHGLSWMPVFLHGLKEVTGHYTTQILLVAALAWGLFEWHVKSENKTFMRLSALGTAAVSLMVVVILTTASLVISFAAGVPAMGKLARPFAVQQIHDIDNSVSALTQALAKNDWEAMREQADRASLAMSALTKAGPALRALASRKEPAAVEELRAHLKIAGEALSKAQGAIVDKDAGRLVTALGRFHESYNPVREASTKLPK